MKSIIRSLLISLITLLFITFPVVAVVKKPTVSVQKQTISKVEYQLPYPGILPDNPLYFLKSGRDKLMDFLIADPVRKAEFYILQSDKRLGMATGLFDKGNATLAETTLSKSQTYMDMAVSTLVNAKSGGKEVPGYLVDRLDRSLAKHIEILTERAAAATDPVKSVLNGSVMQLQKLEIEHKKLN